MRPFAHQSARSLDEALAAARSGRVRWLAGGADLLGVLKDEILPEYPETLVNLKTIPGLDRIEPGPGALRIGAAARLTAVAEHPEVKARYPLLRAAALSVATPEIRNMGTLGGNLCQDTRCWYYRYPHHLGGRILCRRKGSGPCHAVRGDNRFHAVVGAKGCFAACPSDTAVALAALGATLRIEGPAGPRLLPVHELYSPLGLTLAPGELVVSVTVPRPAGEARQAFEKFTFRRPVDFAVVSLALVVALDGAVCREARVWLGGVAPGPHRDEGAEEALRETALADQDIEAACDRLLGGAKPLAGNGYKIQIAKTLLRRTLGRMAR
ncbi:FAD binding domain-containing protein [Deferrisoma palaeochoriense]